MQIQPFHRGTAYNQRRIGVFLLCLAFFGIDLAPLRADVVIAPHRAAYTLELKRMGRDSTVSDASGAMVYTWGETCDGWTVEQQFLLNVVQANGNPVSLTAVSSTWESKDGKRLRFNIKRERNGSEVEKIRGEGRLESVGGAGEAQFELPVVKRIKLPAGTVFPTMHTLRLMARAQDGARTDRQIVFDGSEVEPPGPVSAFILPLKTPAEKNEALTPPLGPDKVRNIHLAFFGIDTRSAEPEFEMSIELQDNGVALSLILDYGEYAVRANLVRIEALEKPDC